MNAPFRAPLGRIDHYGLVRKLGGGGFGVVYLAKDGNSGVDVALKTLHPMLKSNAEELESVRENFKLVAGLYHPNIAAALSLHRVRAVAIEDDEARLDLKLAPGDSVMVMAYAPGVPLSKWKKRFPGGVVPFDVALEIGRQVSSALDYAHGERIVHRDVKPGNVMVEELPDGRIRARVLDFGLAAEIRSSMGRMSQETGDTSGTRPYMAPEQWLGKKQNGRTDQYALACVLYELLSGDPPFAGVFDTGDPVIMMAAVENREPDPIESLDPSRNAALLKGLAKKPGDRFESCGELLRALETGIAPVAANEAPALSLSATVGGSVAAGAELSVGDQTVPLPARLELAAGSSFGPGRISFVNGEGRRFVGRFDPIPVDWAGERELSVPLFEEAVRPGAKKIVVRTGRTMDRSAAPAPGEPAPAEPPKRRMSGVWAAVATVVVLLGAAALFMLRPSGAPPPVPAAQATVSFPGSIPSPEDEDGIFDVEEEVSVAIPPPPVRRRQPVPATALDDARRSVRVRLGRSFADRGDAALGRNESALARDHFECALAILPGSDASRSRCGSALGKAFLALAEDSLDRLDFSAAAELAAKSAAHGANGAGELQRTISKERAAAGRWSEFGRLAKDLGNVDRVPPPETLARLLSTYARLPDGAGDSVVRAVAAGLVSLDRNQDFQKVRDRIPNASAFQGRLLDACGACGGRGQGSGTRCTDCGGSGVCASCHGKGRVYLGNVGWVGCSRCVQEARGKCRACGGRGSFATRCTACGGSGKRPSTSKAASVWKEEAEMARRICLEKCSRWEKAQLDPSSRPASRTMETLAAKASAGNAEALCERGAKRWAEKDPLAFDDLRRASDAGDAMASLLAGFCALDGIGTAADPARAFSFFGKAARGGDRDAMLALAHCHATGMGTAKDPEEASDWYERSRGLERSSSSAAPSSSHSASSSSSPSSSSKFVPIDIPGGKEGVRYQMPAPGYDVFGRRISYP